MKSLNGIMNSIGTKRLVIYALIAIICVIVIGIAVYFQFFYSSDKQYRIEDIDGTEISENSKVEQIKTEFNSTFNNSIRIALGEDVEEVKKIDNTKDLVYTMYKIDMYSENNYDININLPVINIDSEVAKKINKEIDNTFGKKTNSVVQSKGVLSIYNIDYVAYLKDNILSLVIKATLKELDYPQRVIIKTYNYNVLTNQEVTLGTLLLKKGLDKNKVYEKVQEEISEIIEKNEAFAQQGYEVFKRYINDEMYLPINTEMFFMDINDRLYLIYAYGNKNFTSEMDIVIF